MPRITKMNLSGGKLGASLHTRSDLEAYAKGNFAQSNFLATPYGGIVRRSPATWVAGVPNRDEYTPEIVRGFQFIHSNEVKYSLILVAYTHDTEDPVTYARIYDDAGVFKAEVGVPFLAADLYELDYVQINDVAMFTHQDYAPSRITRTGDTEWSYELVPIIGGPLLDQNTDRGIEMSIQGALYDAAHPYDIGDVVQLGGIEYEEPTDARYTLWKTDGFRTDYLMELYVATPGTFLVGDTVVLEGVDSAAGSPNYFVFDATYTILGIDGNWLRINTDRYSNLENWIPETGEGDLVWYNDYSLPDATSLTGSSITRQLDDAVTGVGFWQSLTDANTGNPPATGSLFWARAYSGLTLQIASNQAVFSQDDVGRKISLLSDRNISVQGQFDQAGAVQYSEPIAARGVITLTTGGIWDGVLTMEVSYDNMDTWDVVAELNGLSGSKNYSISRTIASTGAMVRLTKNGWTAIGSDALTYALDLTNDQQVVSQIVGFVDTHTVTVAVEGPISLPFSTYKWSLGAFGGSAGYPGRMIIHEERLTFGGTTLRPFEIYGSEVNNWDNFTIGSSETSPIIFRLQADNVTQIKWLLSRSSQLYIGTDFGEYVASTPDQDTVISAVNPPRITLITPYGSDLQNAIAVHDEIAHVVGDAQTVRSLAQKEYTDSATSKSLTIFSPDISESGIKEMHLQRNPYAVIWAVRNDGKLVAFTYDVENGVMGWAEIELTGSDIRSHWIMPNDQGIDEVYFIDQRDDIAVIASGATLPTEVNGEYLADGSAVSISNGFNLQDSSVSRAPYEGLYQRDSYDAFWHVTEPYEMYKIGTDWILNHADTDTVILSVESDKQLPPLTGWTNDAGQDVGTIAYTFDYVNGSYGSAQGIDGNYYLFDGYADRNALFSRSGSIWGDYAPLGTSTGTLSVGQISFNIEKFEYIAPTATQQNADLNESAYTSLVEFSSLVQGPESLERDIFRCVRVIIHMVRSQGGEVSVDGGLTWKAIEYDDDELFTGFKEVRVNSGNVRDLRVMFRAVGLDPFEMTGVAVDIEKQTGD